MGGGASSSNSPERVKGIEPSSQAWKAYALPLSYTRGQSRLISRPPRPPFFASFFSLCLPLLVCFVVCGKSRLIRAATFPLSVEGAGFEPAKAEPSDLQSDPFDRSGTPPKPLIIA